MKFIAYPFSKVSLAFWVMYSSSVFATENVSEIGGVIVTASGSAQQLKNAPASVTVINQQQLKNQPATNLIDMLKDVPSVAISGSGVNKQDIALRGLPADYTLILVDGKRQNSRESRLNGNGGFESGFIPPIGAISRIEVVRGPMSSLYGSDAMGGVVNIITKEASKEWTGAFSLGGTLQENDNAGSGYDSSFFLSGPIIANKLGVQAYGGGNFRQEDKFVGGFNKNNNKNINTKLTFTPTEKQTLIFEMGRNVQKKSETAGKSLALQTCRAGSCTQNSNVTTVASRNHWSLSYLVDWDILRSELSVYQEKARRQLEYVTGYNSRQPEITNTVVDAKFMLPIQKHFLVFGGQYQHGKLSDDSVKSVNQVTNPRTGATRSTADFTLTTNKAIQKSVFLEDEIIMKNMVRIGILEVMWYIT